jgi:hypothetical protein
LYIQDGYFSLLMDDKTLFKGIDADATAKKIISRLFRTAVKPLDISRVFCNSIITLSQMYMMLTTRYPWKAAAVLLCALLLQSCRSQLNALEEEACDGEKCVRKDTLSVLLDMARSEPDRASEFLAISLAAAKDENFRQDSLEALGKVAQAAPGMVSDCFPVLRTAAQDEDRDIRLMTLRTLGEVEWRHYFGDVGAIPNLPSNIDAILDGPCPIWPRKKVKDTHLLLLIPTTVDGTPFTLDLLGELIQSPKNGGHKTKYRYYDDKVKVQFGEKSPVRSYWLLMTRSVLTGSRAKEYLAQRSLVAGHAKGSGMPYEVPCVLEAATAVLMHHARTGERLWGDSPLIYTRCQELVDGAYPAVVGNFEPSGLFVYHNHFSTCVFRGVACCRRF